MVAWMCIDLALPFAEMPIPEAFRRFKPEVAILMDARDIHPMTYDNEMVA